MTTNNTLAVFENFKIRRIYVEKTETWFFSVIDIIQVLTDQSDYQTARKYWNKLKERLSKEGSQSVTDCHQLKLEASDEKNFGELKSLEPMAGIEPATYALRKRCSTPELHRRFI